MFRRNALRIPLSTQQSKWEAELRHLVELGVSADDQTLLPLLEKHRGVVIDVVADLQQQQPQRSWGADGMPNNCSSSCGRGRVASLAGANLSAPEDGQQLSKTQLKKQTKRAAREARKLEARRQKQGNQQNQPPAARARRSKSASSSSSSSSSSK